jgi:hypothetical protein
LPLEHYQKRMSDSRLMVLQTAGIRASDRLGMPDG